MAGIKSILLKEICNFEKGSTGLAKAIPGKYPLVATGADRRSCDSFQFDAKAVCIPLVSSTGHGHASLNNVHYQEGKFALGSILVALTAIDEGVLDIQFLHLYLSELKDKILVPLMSGAANVALSVTKIQKPKESKIIELKPRRADYYKRTLLAAEIVDQLHKEPTLGHLKLQKLIFLCQRAEKMQLPTNFLQQAAGPYDPKMARSLDKQLKQKKWFEYHRNDLLKFKPLEKFGSHKEYFNKYFAKELAGIQFLIDLFRKAKSDQLEIVATLYACWENLLKQGVVYSETLLVECFYDWSEEKGKYEEERIRKAITWMQEKNIVPDL